MSETAPTPYDEVAYPTAIFNQTQPDRLATIARLAGLNPPPVETARVLEIGVGDGMNLLALAVAYPNAHFTGFDLAPTAIERGQKWLAATGIANVTLEVLDILDAADKLDDTFDYIIAHGVYAWVPPNVRAATMTLIGKKLSANGVAFVSYNALPGGYMRYALRDTLLFALEGVPEAARQEAARGHLAVLAEPAGVRENPAQIAFRDAAKLTLDKPWSVLCHDELGPCFFPQALTDVADDAAANGLKFLGDADRERIGDVFLPDDCEDDSDADVQALRIAQAGDYREFRFFRQTLFVRDSAQPSRRLDQDAIADLFATTRCADLGDGSFQLDSRVFEMADPDLARAMTEMVAARPRRIRVRDFADTPARRSAMFQLFNVGLIDLATVQAPHALALSDRPTTSPLVRMMIAEDMPVVCRLDQRLLSIPEFGPRHVLSKLDGSLDRAAIEEVGREAGLETPEDVDRALAMLVRECVLVA